MKQSNHHASYRSMLSSDFLKDDSLKSHWPIISSRLQRSSPQTQVSVPSW